MAFSYDPTTAAGQVRLLIGDTNLDEPKLQVFQDAEIDAFLSLGGNSEFKAAALALKRMAADAAKRAIAYNILASDFQVDRTKVKDGLLALAKAYEEDELKEPGFHLLELGWHVDPADGIDRNEHVDDGTENHDFYHKLDFEQEGDV